EVAEERPARYPGRGSDVLHGRVVEPTLREELQRDLLDRGSRAGERPVRGGLGLGHGETFLPPAVTMFGTAAACVAGRTGLARRPSQPCWLNESSPASRAEASSTTRSQFSTRSSAVASAPFLA